MSDDTSPQSQRRRRLADLALEGLSVGDAFGQRFFSSEGLEWLLARKLPPGPWAVTDDTEMALAVADVLAQHGSVDQERLATMFAERYRHDPLRGYGASAHGILQGIGRGVPWRQASLAIFDGAGSMGNGAAMRVAPLGAWFADDHSLLVAEARRSAEVTHGHPDGQAGAIAIAAATAWAASGSDDIGALFDSVLAATPDGYTREGIVRARDLPRSYTVETAVAALGNGKQVISSDTVPLCTWLIARHHDSYEDALWSTAWAGGDRDTTCAIVGGVLATRLGMDSIPSEWRARREPLVRWSGTSPPWGTP